MTAGRFDLELVTTVSASPDRSFGAFTDPLLLSRWFTTAAEVDLRVGGRYRNGDHDQGEYLIVDPPHRVHFTWENPGHCPGTTVEVEFEGGAEESTKVILRHRGIETAEGREDMREGWTWALASFKSFLERGVPIPHAEWVKQRSENPGPGGSGSEDA